MEDIKAVFILGVYIMCPNTNTFLSVHITIVLSVIICVLSCLPSCYSNMAATI